MTRLVPKAAIHLMYEPVGYVALKTACGLDCSPDREPFHTLELTAEEKLVTCLECRRYVESDVSWIVEHVTHRKAGRVLRLSGS